MVVKTKKYFLVYLYVLLGVESESEISFWQSHLAFEL